MLKAFLFSCVKRRIFLLGRLTDFGHWRPVYSRLRSHSSSQVHSKTFNRILKMPLPSILHAYINSPLALTPLLSHFLSTPLHSYRLHLLYGLTHSGPLVWLSVSSVRCWPHCCSSGLVGTCASPRQHTIPSDVHGSVSSW